jgi:DNA-binding winged helix-turn-helix (wHTH) protein/Flp pilus assembly protein TadD
VRVQSIWQFGDFRFDLPARLLTQGSRRLELSPKALEVLAVLVKNAGQVVSKDSLLDIVWPDTPVEEGNLAVHIFALRRALGENASGAAYIETIPKRGYRFAAPLFRVSEDSASPPADQPRDLGRIAEHYLQQQRLEGCCRAAAAYREWMAKEPGSVEARAGLANTLLFRFVLGDLSREEVVPRAEALLREADEIDSWSAGLHLSRSRLLCLSGGQWDRAEEELHRALETADNDEIRSVVRAWLGFDLVGRGEMQRGLAELRRSSEACPLSTYVCRMLADAYFLARDFQGSVVISRKALQLHPSCCLLYRALGRALTALGEYGQARRSFHRATVLSNQPPISLLAEIAYLDAIAGNRDRAVAFLSRLQQRPRGQHVSRVLIAEIHAALGDKQRALDYIEEARLTRDWATGSLKQNSRLDGVRNTPRYRSVMAQLGR